MLKFETVAVVVRNEKKATKFWKDKVGFRVVTSFPHWVTVAPRGSNVRLHLCPDSRPEKGTRDSSSPRRTRREKRRGSARTASRFRRPRRRRNGARRSDSSIPTGTSSR